MLVMAVTYQVYEWMNMKREVNAQPEALAAGGEYDIFTGSVGNSVSNSNVVRSNQFVVMNDMSVTPFSGLSVNLRINTTKYFQNPDTTVSEGVSGLLSPYPCGNPRTKNVTLVDSVRPAFSMEKIPVYILPGQSFTVEASAPQAVPGGGGEGAAVGCAVVYTLYDGADALVANKLLESGFPITEDNVNTYKMNLLQQNELMEGLE